MPLLHKRFCRWWQCRSTLSYMTKFILTILTCFCFTLSFGQFKPKGTFIGLVPMKGYGDPAKPQYKWYHLSELTCKDDSVFLEQSPVAIFRKDTIFSASDGGFYSYAGTIRTFKGSTFTDMNLITCDYCPNQFIKFIPPKLVTDIDTTQTSSSDTTVTIAEPWMIENASIKHKSLLLEKTKSPNTLLLDGIVYTRKKKK